MTYASNRQQSSARHQLVGWWRRVVTLVVLVNLGLVLFHLSYGSLRSQLSPLPQLMDQYAPIYQEGLWQIDRYFTAFFGLEYLSETWLLSRQRSNLTWPQLVQSAIALTVLAMAPYHPSSRLCPSFRISECRSSHYPYHSRADCLSG